MIRTALRTLGRSPMRTLLTMLGVVIGVASVITMLAMATGATREIQDRIASLGSNVMFIWSEAPKKAGVSGGRAEEIDLTPDDVRAMVRECPAVKAGSPMSFVQAQIVFQDQNWNTSVIGAGVDYPDIRKMALRSGRWFGEDEVTAASRVCVLGPDVAETLFGTASPEGLTVRVKGNPFKVIGVLEAKGGSGAGMNQDDRVYAPYTTVMRRLDKRRWIAYAMVSAHDSRMDEAMTQIETLLRERHKIGEEAPNDFSIRTQTEIAQRVSSEGQAMTLFFGGVAAISLLVGGIGIMNIMLVSVTERIREIGIRLAVGARGRDIMLQFLIESVAISGFSGLIGIGLGVALAKLAASLSEWSFYVSTESIVLAFGFSVLIGVFFGFYPAFKASRLDPIEALRTD